MKVKEPFVSDVPPYCAIERIRMIFQGFPEALYALRIEGYHDEKLGYCITSEYEPLTGGWAQGIGDSEDMMSYGTRKAIAGMRTWEEKTDQMVEEAIRRYDAAKTTHDVREVLEWSRGFNWFLRSQEQDERMKASFDAAVKRAQSLASPEPGRRAQ